LDEYRLNFQINHILISGIWHGDHFFWVAWVLNFSKHLDLLGRKNELACLTGPKENKGGLLTYFWKLGIHRTELSLIFSTSYHLERRNDFMKMGKVIITTIPLEHRIIHNGFLFKEKLAERN